MTYITGDLYGDFRRLERFCQRMDLGPSDIVIALRDTCINTGHPVRNRLARQEVDLLHLLFHPRKSRAVASGGGRL